MNVLGNGAHYARDGLTTEEAAELIAARKAREGFTVAVCEGNGHGTHHVAHYATSDIETAKQNALEQCAADWGLDEIDGLCVLFVARGNVDIVEYQEPWL